MDVHRQLLYGAAMGMMVRSSAGVIVTESGHFDVLMGGHENEAAAARQMSASRGYELKWVFFGNYFVMPS